MTTFMTYKEECESLRRELENERARDIHSCGPDCTRSGCVNRRLREELAAIQAREQQLLEVLRDCYIEFFYVNQQLNAVLDEDGEPLYTEGKTVTSALAKGKEALALPQDTTALEAMIAKAGEVMRERCAKHLESCAQSFAEEYGHDDLGCLSFGSGAAAELRMDTFNGWMEDADAIRALPAVTLDDLKGGA